LFVVSTGHSHSRPVPGDDQEQDAARSRAASHARGSRRRGLVLPERAARQGQEEAGPFPRGRRVADGRRLPVALFLQRDLRSTGVGGKIYPQAARRLETGVAERARQAGRVAAYTAAPEIRRPAEVAAFTCGRGIW